MKLYIYTMIALVLVLVLLGPDSFFYSCVGAILTLGLADCDGPADGIVDGATWLVPARATPRARENGRLRNERLKQIPLPLRAPPTEHPFRRVEAEHRLRCERREALERLHIGRAIQENRAAARRRLAQLGGATSDGDGDLAVAHTGGREGVCEEG